MAGLGSLASGLRSVSQTKRGEIYIVRANDDGAVDTTEKSARKFQYFPASITDSKAVTYQSREVPGGSLPIYQWTNSGERTIGFTVYFTTDVDHLAVPSALPIPSFAAKASTGSIEDEISAQTTNFDNAANRSRERLKAAGALDRNPFIPGALLWLRQFMLPRYEESSSKIGTPLTFSPRKLWLVIPNSGIGMMGGEGGFSGVDRIFCHMTQCEIAYEALFPSGNLRHVQVTLAFAENPQQGGAVRFPQFGKPNGYNDKAYRWYGLTPSGTKK